MTFRFHPLVALLLAAGTLLLTGCRKPEIRVYLAPKDPPPAPPTAAAHVHNPNDPNDVHDDEPAARPPERPKPSVTFTAPPEWQTAPPGAVSLAAFVAKGDGMEANINITPLPDLRGRESMVVNMYRQQTGQPPIEQVDLDKTMESVEVAGGQGQLLELLGANRGKPTRLITVIAHRDDRSWFYRISGDDAFVTAQKPAFLAFLKTVRITDPSADSVPPPPALPLPEAPAAESSTPSAATEPKPQP